jgi:NAD+ kinase
MTPDVKRILLVTHGDPQVTAATLPALAAALTARGVELVLSEDEVAKHPDVQPISVDRPDDVDLILVLGGDGTMLRALHRVIDRPVACVGVNYGTFGFLTTMRANEMLDRLPDILGGGLEVVNLPTVSVETPDGRFIAINDVLVTADQLGRMAVLEWAVNGVDLGQRGCDGILISTPAGSTGYNLSAGGSVIDLKLLGPKAALPRSEKGLCLEKMEVGKRNNFYFNFSALSIVECLEKMFVKVF